MRGWGSSKLESTPTPHAPPLIPEKIPSGIFLIIQSTARTTNLLAYTRRGKVWHIPGTIVNGPVKRAVMSGDVKK